jgi:hypothetical protein
MRWITPALKSMASVRVVLPALPWPTRATLRILDDGNVFNATVLREIDGSGRRFYAVLRKTRMACSRPGRPSLLT